jgi:zinc protease
MATRSRKKQHATHPLFERVGAYHGIEEYRHKKNGLRVLYRHDDTSPVVGLMVTYLVGSRHEAIGNTGSTHLLEHLMFKGSKNFPKKHGISVLELLSEKGALVNASTWLDRTNYFEVLPKEQFDFALRLEADRMRNAIITRKDLDEEMPAVRSEYAMGENDPMESLDKHLWASAYMAHPYHHSTIGWLSDIEGVSIERLKHFYDTYYWPNNAVVTVIGDASRDEVLALIDRYFGVHPRSPHAIPEPYTTEPKQLGRRFVEVKRAGTKNMLAFAYKVPEALHQDTPALMALSSILADGQTSRLYRALVEKNLATSVRSVYMPFRDPSLLTIYVTLTEGISHARVEKAFRTIIATMLDAGVSEDELARVLSRLETEIAFARDGHYAMLSNLNEAIAVGDWKFFFDLPETMGRVTTDDISRVSRTYLCDEGETLGYYCGIDTHTTL